VTLDVRYKTFFGIFYNAGRSGGSSQQNLGEHGPMVSAVA